MAKQNYHAGAQRFIKSAKAQGRKVTREGSELIAGKTAPGSKLSLGGNQAGIKGSKIGPTAPYKPSKEMSANKVFGTPLVKQALKKKITPRAQAKGIYNKAVKSGAIKK